MSAFTQEGRWGHRMRMWLVRKICPADYRLVEALFVVTDEDTAANDLVRGGDALARGWGCGPDILYNGAAVIRRQKAASPSLTNTGGA